jgi:hypothetical protein
MVASLSEERKGMTVIPCLDFWFRDAHGYIFLCLKAKGYRGLYRELDPSNPPEISLRNKEENFRDAFFSVCTFESNRRAASNVLHVPGLWVDMDYKDYPDGELEAAVRLFEFPIRPSFAVLTGNGMHVYWKFEVLQEPSDRIRNLLHTVTAVLKADFCADFARLLRIPGTLNCKPVIDQSGQEVRSEKPVKCILTSFETYSVDDFENNECLNQLAVNEAIAPTSSVCSIKLDYSPEIDEVIDEIFQQLLREDSELRSVWKGENPKFRSRSEYDMSMALRLCWKGFSNSDIHAILWGMPSGKGRGGSREYFQYTIGKARAMVLERLFPGDEQSQPSDR